MVKVAADPVVFWFNVATLAAAIVPEAILLPFIYPHLPVAPDVRGPENPQMRQ